MNKGGYPIILIGLSSIFFAYSYTGGPFPLSRMALGEFFAFIFFGPIPVWGSYYLQTHSTSYMPLIFGIIPGLIAMTLMGINNLRDYKSDKDASKKTIATIMGIKNMRSFCYYSAVASFLTCILLAKFTNYTYAMLGIIPFILLFKNFKSLLDCEITSELNNNLAKTGMYMFLQAICMSIGIILS